MAKTNKNYQFPALHVCLREYLFIYKSYKANENVFWQWWYSTSMHMCMSISKEGDVHAQAHPIILHACSAHVQSVKVVDQTNKALSEELKSSEKHRVQVVLMVKALSQTPRDLGLSPSQHSNFSCSTCLLKRIFIYL